MLWQVVTAPALSCVTLNRKQELGPKPAWQLRLPMGTRKLMYTCVCMGRASAPCLGPVARWAFGLSVWRSCRLCESEGAQGTHVVTVGVGLSVDTDMGALYLFCPLVEV